MTRETMPPHSGKNIREEASIVFADSTYMYIYSTTTKGSIALIRMGLTANLIAG